MRTKFLISLLWLHAILLALASTRLYLLSWIWEDGSLNYEYFRYASSSGFGHKYESYYNLATVLAYLAAYGCGFIAFLMSRKRIPGWSLIGVVLCVLGMISFLIEGSHWVWKHNRSWIASSPFANVILVIIVTILLYRFPSPQTNDRATVPD